MRKWWNRLVFAVGTLRRKGVVRGGRFLSRWYYARLHGYPHLLNFEVTSICNLRCPFCYTQSQQDLSGRTQRSLRLDTFRRIIDDTSRYCTAVSLHGMGEPLLHPDLPAMIAHAHHAGMEVSFSTNGLLMTRENARKLIDSGLDKLIVSMDGLSEETYRLHRAGAKEGDLDRLQRHVRELVALKRELGVGHPEIQLQFIVTRQNAHEAEAFWQTARELEADGAALMSLAIDDYVRDPEFGRRVEDQFFVSGDAAFSRYRIKVDGTRTLVGEETRTRVCPQHAGEPVITSDARIVGCCKDLHSLDDTFGNLDEQGFTAVWDSPAFRTFRAEVMMPGKMRKCDSCFPAPDVAPFCEVRRFDAAKQPQIEVMPI